MVIDLLMFAAVLTIHKIREGYKILLNHSHFYVNSHYIITSVLYTRGSQPFLTHGTLYYFLKIWKHPVGLALYSIVYTEYAILIYRIFKLIFCNFGFI
jgi:hypothetical protein